MATTDDFNPADFLAFAAALGIKTEVFTDAFGRTDVRIDRDGMEKIRDAAQAHGFPDIAARIGRELAP